jgi:hypothetical protein
MLARINKLLEDVRRDPFTGIGKPEPLKYHLPPTPPPSRPDGLSQDRGPLLV